MLRGAPIEHSPTVVYTRGPDNLQAITSISEDVYDLTGLGATWFLAEPGRYASRIHPDDSDRVDAAMQEAVVDDSTRVGDHRFLHGDGSYLWLRDTTRATCDADGRGEIAGSVIDITDLMAAIEAAEERGQVSDAERRVKEREERTQLVADNLPVLISYVDADLRYQFCNETYEEWTGLARDDILGAHVRDALGDEYYERVLGRMTLALSGEPQQHEALKEHPTLGPRRLLVNYVPHVSGEEVVGLFVLAADITARIQAETAVRESEARLQSVMDSAVDAILTINERGVIKSANRATADMFGYASGELVGRDLRTLMPEPYRAEHRDHVARYVETGEAKIIGIGREVQGLRADGTVFPMELSVGEAEVEGEKLFTGIVRDITSRKALEERLSELNAHLEQLVAERTADLARETEEHRRTRDLMERVLASAQCLLWHGSVDEAADGSFVWDIAPVNEDAASESLPLDVADGQGWHDALREARLPEHRDRADRTAEAAFRGSQTGYSQDLGYVDRHGVSRSMRENVFVEPDGDGRWRVRGVMVDNTNWRHAEDVRTMLHEILEAAHATPTLGDMYRTIRESLLRLIDFTRFSVALVVDDDPNLFAFAYWVDEDGTGENGPPIEMPRSRTAIVARTRETHYFNATQTHQIADAGELEFHDVDPRAWVGSPLVVGDRLIGVLRIGHQSASDPYTARDIDVVTYAAQQIAIAIDRRRAHDALRNEQRLFQALMDNLPDTIYMKDLESRFLRVNAVCAASLGMARASDAVGLSDTDIWPGEEARRYRAEEEEVMRSGEAILGRIDGDGSGHWVSTTKAPLRDESGEVIGLVGVNRDVSVAMRVREALRESETQRTQLLEQMIAVQEEERARISRELHDQVGQELTSVLIGLRVIESAKTTEEATRQSAALREVTASTLEDVRQIAFDMRPSSLDDLGMATALNRDLKTLAQNAGIAASFQSHNPEDISLPTEMEVGIYRIVHTALTNVVRHANAKSINVLMRTRRTSDGMSVAVLIEDDGVGFDVGAVLSGPVEGRFGLLSMQERARLMGGKVSIESVLGEGSAVVVEIPKKGWPLE